MMTTSKKIGTQYATQQTSREQCLVLNSETTVLLRFKTENDLTQAQ